MAATISEENMQIMEEMLEDEEGLEPEDKKAELDELVHVMEDQLDYFNEDKKFDREVDDAVQEIETFVSELQ